MTIYGTDGYELHAGTLACMDGESVRILSLPPCVEADDDGPCAEARVELPDGRVEYLPVYAARQGAGVCYDLRCGAGR